MLILKQEYYIDHKIAIIRYLFRHRFAILSYMRNSNKPHLLITVGLPGSGKSFFAEHFAETFKAPIVSYEKLKLLKRQQDIDGDGVVDDYAKYILKEIMKTSQTIVYDGLTDSKKARMELVGIARELNYDPMFIWVQTDEATARKRALKITDSHKFSVTEEEFDNSKKRFTAPNQKENPIVISGKHNYASQLKIVLKNLASRQLKDDVTPAKRNFLRDVITK